jgi:beclin 1
LRQHEQHAIDLLGESFVVLPPLERKDGKKIGQEGQTTTMDKQTMALTAIFEIASDKSQIDQPLCTNCSEAVYQELDKRLKEVERDRDTYKAMLDKLSSEPKMAESPVNTLADEKLEKELEEQLAKIRVDRESLNKERKMLEDETKAAEKFEQRFWEDYQQFQMDLDAVNDEQNAVRQQIKVATERIDRLKRTNVYDDAFHISYDGHFGTINGFRLGRLQSQQVDWQETNAALGQVVLLLYTIARVSNYKFQKYRLIPMGSFSKMCKLEDPNTTYELYGSNDLSLGKMFWYRRFDTALMWLLLCIKEFGDYASSIDKRFKLRYAIKNDNIGDVSIRLQFNQDPKWTKALKYMLTNLKFLLVWVSKRQD